MAYLNRLIIRIVMCLVFAGIWIGVSGQKMTEDIDNKIDSLISLLDSLPRGTEMLDVLNKICIAHYNVDSTFKYASKELDLAEMLSDVFYLASANKYLG